MDKTVKFWDGLAKNFDVRVKKYFSHAYKVALEKAVKYLNSNDIVLDFACGTGIVSLAVADRVKRIEAIDISSKMIEAAKLKVYEKQILNISFSQRAVFDPDFKEGSFDAVVAFNILHLVDDPDSVLRRLKSLLRPGGMIISTTACMREKKSLINLLVCMLVKVGAVPRMSFFKIADLEKVFMNAGLCIVEAESLHQGAMDYFIAARK